MLEKKFAVVAAESFSKFWPVLSEPSTVFGAFGLSLMTVMVGADNLRLLSIVTLAMLADIVVGGLWSIVSRNHDFCIHKLFGGILGKIFRLMLIPIASLADWLIISSPFASGIDTATYGYPIASFALWALAIAEIISSLKKFKEAGVMPETIDEIIKRINKFGGSEPVKDNNASPEL